MSDQTNQIRERMAELRDGLVRLSAFDVLSKAQESEYQRISAEFNQLDAEHRELRMDELRTAMAAGHTESSTSSYGEHVQPTRRSNAGLALRRDQSMADWVRCGSEGSTREDLSLGGILRGMATGRWDGFDAEQRAISETPLSAGGYMVPAPVAADVIDKARNVAAVLRAGATIVPMASQSLKYPRLLTEGTPAWRLEAAQINDSALSFDAVTLTAQSLAIMVKCSWELLEDATPSVSGVVTNSFAAQVALELDRVALRGTGTAPEPRGIRNTTGVTVTAFGGANGATPTNYDLIIDAAQVIRAANFEPNGIVTTPRGETTLAKLKESTGAYLPPPTAIAGIPRYATNQLPTNLTVGTSNDTSELYIGQWDQLIFGVRTGFTVRVLEERFADFGQVAFLATLRGDFAVAQAAAFNVVTGIRP